MTAQSDVDRLTLVLAQAIVADRNYAGDWQTAAIAPARSSPFIAKTTIPRSGR